ncbi:MAG: cupin domain-containing protein [Hyphomicrobiaceae bacterium]
MTEKISLGDLLKKIPGPATRAWPKGEPFADGLQHGTMSVELFAPRGRDYQKPHEQDELYIVVGGTANFIHNATRTAVEDGDVLFVPAGDEHQFENISHDFLTWVVFWGPKGGE